MIFSLIFYGSFLFALIGIYFLFEFVFKGSSKKRLFEALAASTLLFIVFCLKSKYVGSDTITYFDAYDDLLKNNKTFEEAFSKNYHFEAGFYIIFYYFAYFHIPYFLFSAFVYLTICGGIFLASYKFSKNPIYSIFIFVTFVFYNFFISGLRQAWAIGICLYALVILLSEKQKWFYNFLYFLLVAAASLIHQSALIFVVVFFLRKFELTEGNLVSIFLLSIFIYLFGYYFFKFIFDFLVSLNIVDVASYAPYTGGIGKTTIALLLLSLLCALILTPTKFQNFLRTKIELTTQRDDFDKKTGFFTICVAIGTWVELFNRYSSGIGRLGMYFTVPFIFLVPNAIEKIHFKKSKLICYAVFSIFFVGFFLYYSIIPNNMNIWYSIW